MERDADTRRSDSGAYRRETSHLAAHWQSRQNALGDFREGKWGGISMMVKCIKDTEGYWTEEEMYPATENQGGFILVGDDDDPHGEGWIAAPVEYRDDGSIIFQLGGIEGEVLFEERAA